MRVLLDTHALLWWVADSRRLSSRAFDVVANPPSPCVVSAASAWELATKFRLGRLPEAEALAFDISRTIREQGFEELRINAADAWRAGSLPGPHRDPFDRLLAAQAQAHDLAIVSADAAFDHFGVLRIW